MENENKFITKKEFYQALSSIFLFFVLVIGALERLVHGQISDLTFGAFHFAFLIPCLYFLIKARRTR